MVDKQGGFCTSNLGLDHKKTMGTKMLKTRISHNNSFSRFMILHDIQMMLSWSPLISIYITYLYDSSRYFDRYIENSEVRIPRYSKFEDGHGFRHPRCMVWWWWCQWEFPWPWGTTTLAGWFRRENPSANGRWLGVHLFQDNSKKLYSQITLIEKTYSVCCEIKLLYPMH